jgi:hypothetical protein
MSEVATLLRQIVGTQIVGVLATVFKVDTSNATCDIKPEDGTAEILNVRLQSVESTNQLGIIIYPVEGSHVTAINIGGDHYQIVGYTEIERIAVKIGDKIAVSVHKQGEIKINADQITINDGNLGGLVKVLELEQQLNKVKYFVDAVCQLINSTIIAEPGNGAASALQIALKGVLSAAQSPDFSNLSNPKIKQ